MSGRKVIMSGGHFDYHQYQIRDIYETLEEIILKNRDIDQWEQCYGFSDEVVAEFKEAVALLKKAYIYAQRIDWLLSGDDSEEYFHLRLNEELSQYSEEFHFLLATTELT